nr:RNA-directed DNA polymerase, eukaryota, reverse transcriptase zinc-binding domain protein [Tanacetum cinerariifolium]
MLNHSNHANVNVPGCNEGTSSVKSGSTGISKLSPGGSILEVMVNLIEVGQTMGYNMEGCLGQSAKKRWIQDLNRKHKVNFVAIQETKMKNINLFSIDSLWGNVSYDYAFSPSVGYSRGILCVWDSNMFVKESVTISDSFVAIRGENAFNSFISMAGLVDLPLDGYKYTWSYKSASKISKLDKFLISEGNGSDDNVNESSLLLKELLDFNARLSLDMAQKAKIRWFIEGDENSKYFYGIINKKRSQLAIRGVLVEVDWIDKPSIVKNEFLSHFVEHGFTFDFYRRYWKLIDQDVVNVVSEFFSSGMFPLGCNSSFITLIPKTQDAKVIKDFRPISLIESVYKIIAKILANRLSLVISDLISDVQSAFVANIQILDGPFIINELISWCKYKKTKAMIFKVDFEKAFDSVRWDYLDDILNKFGFGAKWKNWIQWCLNSAMGSILVNGSPTPEFKFHRGLKQGDPLSLFLFILVMESFHLPFKNILNAGLYKGIQIDESLTLSHLFYADDAMFIGKWDKSNINVIVSVLNCFFLASGLKINLHKSKLIGISSSRNCSWEDVLSIITTRLSKWKLKTLSIGGRLTLLKLVLTSLPLYQMSVYKVLMGVLNIMESMRRNFFNCVDNNDRGINLHGFVKKKVGDREQTDTSMAASFRRVPRGGLEEEQFQLLVDKVGPLILSSIKDRWV